MNVKIGIGNGLYVKNSAEAVPFYMDVFGLELGYHVKNPDGSYYHSELCNKDGSEVLSVVEARDSETHNNIVCLGVTLPDEETVKRAFDLLSMNGEVKMSIRQLPWSSCAAEVVDRFGVWWYLTVVQQRPGDDFVPVEYLSPEKPE